MRRHMLAVLSVVLAGPALAQELPAPCVSLGQLIIVKQCLTREAALADTILTVTQRAAQDAQPASLRDSFAAESQAWLAQYQQTIGAITDPVARLTASLFAKRARAFRLRHAIMVAAAASDTSRMRVLPVLVTFRPATGDRGLLLNIVNMSNRPLPVQIRFYNPTTDELRSQAANLMPNGQTQFSWIQGWTFATGHQVQLLNVSFAPYITVAP